MSVWRGFGRIYILLSVVSASVLAVKFYPMMRGKAPSELPGVLNDLSQVEKIVEGVAGRSPAMQLNLGSVYQLKKQWPDAERMYRKALALDPDHAEAWFRLGFLYQEQHRWAEAAEAYQTSLEKKPGFSQAHNSLGVVYEEMNRSEDAVKEYEEAARLDPDNTVMRNNLEQAREYLEKKKDITVEEPFSSAPAADPGIRIDTTAPAGGGPYFFRSPKRITLKNGRSVVGDIVEKDTYSLWLEVGNGMRTRFSRQDVERIEDAK